MFNQNPNCEKCGYYKNAYGMVNEHSHGIVFCHYLIDEGKIRPYKYNECPGYPIEEKKVEK